MGKSESKSLSSGYSATYPKELYTWEILNPHLYSQRMTCPSYFRTKRHSRLNRWRKANRPPVASVPIRSLGLKGRFLSLVCLRLHFSLHPRRNPRTVFRKSQFLVCISSTWICRSTSIVSCSSSTLVKPPKPSTRRTPSMPRLVSLFCKSLSSNT